ncbi:MAG: hypothetical protein KAH07_01405 [Flavobacteriaceae bacterium]|nr:hypothetical protein [Flavobacteriaceae bacterium]
MKKVIFIALFMIFATIETNAQIEYKVITSVESLVTSGMGRSRIIDATDSKNYEDFTSVRTDDKKTDKRNKSDREAIRIRNFEETKLLNFYNVAGIRFQNIAANDAVITSKINKLTEEGWELAFINTGVESDAGKGDGNALFITRYTFKRNKK